MARSRTRFGPGPPRGGAFTLVELVVTLALTTVVTVSAISYFAALSRTITQPVIAFRGQNYALAPTIRDHADGIAKTDLFDALELHAALARELEAADFVGVFGGGNLDAAAPAPLPPLAATFAATSLPSLLGQAPAALTTTDRVAGAAATDLAGAFAAGADPADFTLVAFQGLAEITAIAQVRRYQSDFRGQVVSLYETTLRARTPPATAWAVYSYRFWLPANEDLWSSPLGARHAWLRAGAGWWNRHEEIGATAAFPDPYVLAAPAAGATVRAHSRFTYFVSASPAL